MFVDYNDLYTVTGRSRRNEQVCCTDVRTHSKRRKVVNDLTVNFLLVVCSSDDSIWHRFRDITTLTVYVTGCDLEKSFIFETIAGTASHVRYTRYISRGTGWALVNNRFTNHNIWTADVIGALLERHGTE